MKKLGGFRLHLVLLGVVALVTAGAHFAMRGRYADERNRLTQDATNERSRQVAAIWRTLPYTNASQEGVMDRFLEKIDWTRLALSNVQKARLQSRVRQVLGYLIAPSFEEYYRLKTEGLHCRFKQSRSATTILAGQSPGVGAGILASHQAEDQPALTSVLPLEGAEASAVCRAMWERLYGPGDRSPLSKLTGICLDHVSTSTTTTNSPGALLQGKVRKGFTAAVEAGNPGFEYPALKERPEPSGSSSVFFQLSFFAQANNSTNAGPVYMCLGWLPEDQEWALCRLISDRWVGMNVLF